MIVRTSRGGYVFLLSILFIGAIAMSTTATLVILGIVARENSLAIADSAQAYQNAQTCIERALRSLRADTGYAGDEVLTLTRGSCTLLPIEGSGNQDRALCSLGIYEDAVRRIEVDVAELLPSGTVSVWEEVSSFTLCDE
jgi:hypothetical protein